MLMLTIGEIKPLFYKGELTDYFISDYGIIYKKNMKPKKTHEIKGGYLRVSIKVGKKQKLVLIHRLVVENFIGPIPKGMEIDHVNGNKKDNSVSNLEIVSPEENMKRAKLNNLIPQGRDRHSTKYDEDLIHKICKYLKDGNFNKKEIAEILHVPVGLVRSIACGSKWKFISSKYNLPQTQKHHKYTYDEDMMILYMKQTGLKCKDIAKIIGVSKPAISTRYRYLKQKYAKG